jgi:Cu(I)/Ag(I) efflux system membrane fusion protein/cobalt-zinc-cadmium efflux system membrane fusion protein
VVFVSLGEGRFQPREVELGVKGEGGVYGVKKGLHEGERVVVSAQFLLDSESRLQEFIRKLMATSKDETP